MLGRTTLFIPGFDHAGISTQSVVEKRLYSAHKQTRHDLGREKFLEKIWEWKAECVILCKLFPVRIYINDAAFAAIISGLHRN